MDYNQTERHVLGAVSGVTCCYWLVFCFLWVRAYFDSRIASLTGFSSAHFGKSSVPFHLGALIFQILSIVFYGFNSTYQLTLKHDNSIFSDVNWLAFSAYTSAAYFVGMSFSLGFGTLHANITAKEGVLIAAAGVAALVGCLFGYFHNSTVRLAGAILLQVVYLSGIAIGVRTIRLISKRIRWSCRQGHDAYTVSLSKCRRKMTTVLTLFSALFVVMVLNEYMHQLDASSNRLTAGFWVAFVSLATVTNTWVLALMRPSLGLMDVENIESLLGVPPTKSSSLIPIAISENSINP